MRAIDFEGNVGAPTTFTWELMGVNVVFTDGPGFTPATGGPQGDPATGGPTASTSAEITFEANVGDVQFWCRFDSLDPGDYFPCESPFRVGPAFAGDTAFPDPLLPGDHVLEVYGESETMGSAAELEPAVYEWEVVDPIDTLPPNTTIERAPVAADLSSTVFEFSGIDDLTPEFLLTFECQVTNGTAAAERQRVGRVHQPVQPARRLLVRRPADAAHRAHVLRARGRHVRARVPGPDAARVRGQPRPDPGLLHLDPGRRHARPRS